jgi:hypothetical protein
VVEPVAALPPDGSALAVGVAVAVARRVAGLCESSRNGTGTGGITALCAAGRTLWRCGLAGADRPGTRPGIGIAATRPTRQERGSKEKPNLTPLCAVQRRRSSVGAIPTRQGVAPAGSNRSGSGGNETAEAFDGKGRLGRLREQTGRNASERRAGLERGNGGADPAKVWGRPPSQV